METLLSIVIALSALVMIVIVSITESDQAGLGTLSGEETSAWGEHRGSSKKDLENRIMKIASVIFVVALIALAAI